MSDKESAWLEIHARRQAFAAERDVKLLAAATLDALLSLQTVGVIGAGTRDILEGLAGLRKRL